MSDSPELARKVYLFGNYKILDTIGRGGMGVVYRAHDVALDRIVALKVLRDDLRDRTSLVARFNREAEAVAKLNHPNIAHIYAVGTVARIPYMAMEYVEGSPLSEIMMQERCMDWRRVFYIAEQVALALGCAHKADIIHRDIKPGNILIGANDHAAVTDFGIAKVLTAEVQLTIDGSRIGTPQYMSPERCQNKQVMAASDIYSLGVVVFQMITGRLPFEATTPIALIRKIIAEQPKRVHDFVEDVPVDVDRVVAYMLEKKVEDRPRSADELAQCLARVRVGKPLETEGSGTVEALVAFRQSIATPLPKTPTPVKAPTTTTTLDRLGHGVSWVRRLWQGLSKGKRRYVLAAMMLCAAVPLVYLTVSATVPPFIPDVAYSADHGISLWRQAPDVAEFIEEAPGILLARVGLPRFTLSGARWAGSEAGAVVQLDGEVATERWGQRALCVVNPSARSARLLVPPVAAVATAEADPAIALLAVVPDTGQGPWLRGRLIVRDFSICSTAGRSGCVFAIPTDCRGPKPAPLLRFFSGDEHPGSDMSEVRGVGPVACKPGGTAMALSLLQDASGPGWVVVERPMSETGLGEPGKALSPLAEPIVSLHYAPDGTRIAYLTDLGGGRRELWLTRSGGSAQDALPIAAGDLTLAEGAFSPDGKLIAVADREEDAGGAIRLVRSGDGGTEAELGEGMSPVWHVSGRFLVTTALDLRGRCQVWAVEASSPHRRTQLTHLDAGCSEQCYISPDGAWALTEVAGGGAPTLAFAGVSSVSF